jgi:CRP/FNR family cyclic AMP-dependent transcriptional regulator
MPGLSIFRHAEDCESFAAGEVIFRAGDPGDAMFVLQEGEVDIVVRGEVMQKLGPDEIFGEMALIDHQPRSASAVAHTDVKVVRVGEQRFRFLIQQTPFFALEVMRIMADRLRQMNKWH